jgi:hypothetical protein
MPLKQAPLQHAAELPWHETPTGRQEQVPP